MSERRTDARVVAVLGLGEAGSLISRDLVAAGAVVRAYDPAVAAGPELVACTDEADAARGADLVLSVNSARAAQGALEVGAGGMGPGAIWADLNTASPGRKRRLDELAAARGIRFADVAMMAPVPGRGLRTPMLASGAAAEDVATLLRGFGTPVDVLAGPAGAAASRKLVRSVFVKGMAAAVVEALEAGRAAGCEEWVRGQIARELASADERTVDRLLAGSYQHAVRRADEMAAAADQLVELGVEPLVTGAARDLLARIASTAGRPAPARRGLQPSGPPGTSAR